LKITVVSGRYRVNNLDPSLFPCHGIAQDFALRPQFLAFPKQAGGPAKRLKLVPPPGTTFASNDASLRCFSGPGALVTSAPSPVKNRSRQARQRKYEEENTEAVSHGLSTFKIF